MSAGLMAFLLGLFVVPGVLVGYSHHLRKRSPRARAVFWGAVIGHCLAALLAVTLGMIPPEAWTKGEIVRGFAGLWSLLLLPLAGAFIGALVPGPRRTRAALLLLAAGFLSAPSLEAQTEPPLRAVSGLWLPVDDGGKALKMDGATWKGEGAPANAFPLAVWTGGTGMSDGTIRVRFKMVGGATDQNAGIVVGLTPDGEYHFLRYNTKDGNLAVWTYAGGERKVLTHGKHHEQLPLGSWQELVVTVTDRKISGVVPGTQLSVEHTFDRPVTGQVGLWTKRDAVTVFRDFTVSPAR